MKRLKRFDLVESLQELKIKLPHLQYIKSNEDLCTRRSTYLFKCNLHDYEFSNSFRGLLDLNRDCILCSKEKVLIKNGNEFINDVVQLYPNIEVKSDFLYLRSW